ncbi:hypothetical protein R8Z50_05910 [Longispora sp. K20-0274]|uniref:hypothetical protein n=1 Tax=Longispora sp. K20-0274 TaxID=3088255 RepID=UPI00399BDFC1
MKRSELLRRMAAEARRAGFKLEYLREGGAHTIYRVNGHNLAVPRHHDVNEQTARSLIADVRKLVS